MARPLKVHPMYEVSREVWFSAAHQLRGYGGKCESLHGHNWKVRVTMRATELDRLGMVVDFKDLKAAMKDVLERLDHHLLNEIPPFDEANPSAERIARHVAEQVAARLDSDRAKVTRCDVWESEGSRAAYLVPGAP